MFLLILILIQVFLLIKKYVNACKVLLKCYTIHVELLQ